MNLVPATVPPARNWGRGIVDHAVPDGSFPPHALSGGSGCWDFPGSAKVGRPRAQAVRKWVGHVPCREHGGAQGSCDWRRSMQCVPQSHAWDASRSSRRSQRAPSRGVAKQQRPRLSKSKLEDELGFHVRARKTEGSLYLAWRWSSDPAPSHFFRATPSGSASTPAIHD